jgi:hypothetical protein
MTWFKCIHGIASSLQRESPLAIQILGMGIGWSEQTLHFNTRVDLPGITLELTPVHLFAHKLSQSSFKACFLGGAAGNGDYHFVLLLLNLIAHQDGPGEIT